MSVKVINATNLRSNLSDTLDDVSASTEPLIIRRHRQADVAMLSADLLEELLELHDPQYVQSIAEARDSIKAGKSYSFEEVFGVL